MNPSRCIAAFVFVATCLMVVIYMRQQSYPRAIHIDYANGILAISLNAPRGTLWSLPPDSPSADLRIPSSLAVSGPLFILDASSSVYSPDLAGVMAHTLGCYRGQDWLLCSPYRVAPQPVLGRGHCIFSTQVTAGAKHHTITWPLGNSLLAAAGTVHSAIPICDGRSVVLVMSPDALDVARQLAYEAERLQQLLHDRGFVVESLPPLMAIAEGTAVLREMRGYLDHPLSNVFVAPHASESPMLRSRLAALFVHAAMGHAWGHWTERERLTASLVIAALVLEGASLRHYLEDVRVLDGALGTLRAEGLGPPTTGSDPVVSTNEWKIVKYVLAPIAAGRLRDIGTSITSNAIRALGPECFSADRQDVFTLVQARLEASSRVSDVPTVPQPVPPDSAPPLIEVAGAYNGLLEECGCIAARSIGGFARLHGRWCLSKPSGSLRILLGDMVATRTGKYYVEGANELIARHLRECHVDVYVPGVAELSALHTAGFGLQLPLTACNVRSNGKHVFPRYRDCLLGSRRTRVIGAVSLRHGRLDWREEEILLEAFEIADPADAIAEVVANTPADYLVVIAGMIHPAELPQLRPSHPALIVTGESDLPRITSGSPGMPQVNGVLGRTAVVFSSLGFNGYDVIAWQPGFPASTKPVLTKGPLDPAHELSRAIGELLDRGDPANVELQFEEPLLAVEAHYTGSEACATCHMLQYEDWLATRHAHAMSTLRSVQRHRVANCVACHVVGFGKPTGYDYEVKQSNLENVGCEVCHGPGSLHMTQPSSSTLIRRRPSHDLCAGCHNEKHSHFLHGQQARYYEQIDHR